MGEIWGLLNCAVEFKRARAIWYTQQLTQQRTRSRARTHTRRAGRGGGQGACRVGADVGGARGGCSGAWVWRRAMRGVDTRARRRFSRYAGSVV
jgi:hypothetical protein